MYPRGGRGHWFPQAYMPNRNFQRGGWDMPQHNCFSDMPGPGWGQFNPRKQRAYDNFDNYRGSYRGRGRRRPEGYFREKHHHRGHSYRGSKSSFLEGSYHHASRYLCLITTNKKENDFSEKTEAHSATSKETKQGTGDSASSVKKTDSPKVVMGESYAV
ncbi:hypothetical protein JD844_018329 [Phrynosoma platyrhinos]|uniref:Uncharacterized protein n=1 Tax=Phrynosoma platyrhinos TaxID=52577 RepID=A0ABQ7SNH1_PHRPL|nr:hypothetical protein JD844_018329 [Phrynosoma platyrhinos]